MKHVVLLVASITGACVAADERDAILARRPPTEVAFTSCEESIGVALVDTSAAQALVPAQIIPVGAGTPVTPLVARTAHCRVDHEPPSSVVQIGLVIVPPATPGTIDNYLLGYVTDSDVIATVLGANGVDVHLVARIDYDAGDTDLDVTVPARHPVLEIAGTIARSSMPNGSFIANWWRANGDALVEMTTTVPEIANGTADLTLTTTFEPLVALIGGGTLGFPILQQYNSFASADMVVTTH